MMSIKFSPHALEQFFYLFERDKRLFKGLKKIIEDTQRNGIGGLGHPEPLSGDSAGWWSKHIDEGNRMVFRIADDVVEIAECYRQPPKTHVTPPTVFFPPAVVDRTR